MCIDLLGDEGERENGPSERIRLMTLRLLKLSEAILLCINKLISCMFVSLSYTCYTKGKLLQEEKEEGSEAEHFRCERVTYGMTHCSITIVPKKFNTIGNGHSSSPFAIALTVLHSATETFQLRNVPAISHPCVLQATISDPGVVTIEINL